MASKFLSCVDCKQEFEFTDGEQKFFKQKGFTDPKRCGPCRKAKKVQTQKKESAGADRDEE